MSDTDWIDELLVGPINSLGNKQPADVYDYYYDAAITAKAAIEQKLTDARIDELKSIVIVMSGIPESERGQYLTGNVMRRIVELQASKEGK